MSKELDKELLKRVAEIIPDRELMCDVYSGMDTDDRKRAMIKFLEMNKNITKQDILLAVVDIRKGVENGEG